jgi:anti-anti-sigma regulatory factor
MEMHRERHVVAEAPRPGIRVARFLCPDLRPQLDDAEPITDCTLYQELHAAALADLAAGETVVLNFGLIDPFPSAFYRLLLAVREAVQARNARLVLCCLTPNVQESFELMGGSKTFEVQASEARAVAKAKP